MTGPVVIGIGNSFRRDDGVGPAVAAELIGRDLDGLRVITCAAETAALLDAWDGAALAVLVDAVLGGEPGKGFYQMMDGVEVGRVNVAARACGVATRAFELGIDYAQQRETFGKRLSDRQGVQFMLAECASELYMARLMLLHIAYKAEKGMDLRQENSIAKVFLAHMVHKVVDTAIQLHGALGYSQDTPLASWYTHIRSQRLVDGPDEVHRWTVGRNVIKAYQAHGTTASAAGGDLI